MSAQAFPWRVPSVARQRGQAMFLLAVLLVFGVSAVIYTMVGTTSVSIANKQADDTARTLAGVKEALIGWSAARTPSTSALIPPGLNARPGDLPCPDTDNTGTDSGSCVAGAIGRVPWRSLGIPEPKDSAGETLWYAIAGPFRNFNMSATPITSDTLGDITVYSDSSATVLASQVVAVIFAPGASLSAQDRSCTVGVNCTAAGQCTTSPASLTPKCNPTNYLDVIWDVTAGVNISNATPAANPTPPSVIQTQPSGTFNDRLLVITNADLMPVVEQRVAREMISILQQYKAATGTSTLALLLPGIGVYPWADRSDGSSNDWNHNRFPCGAALPVAWNTLVPLSLTGARTPALPAWLTNGCTNPVTGWTSVIYYAVAKNKLENNILVPCSNCTDNTLTVTNPSSRVADLCQTSVTCSTSPNLCLTGVNTCNPTSSPAVVSSGSADLILITSGAATTSPRGNWPAADFSLITGFFEDAENAENQGINSDKYVVPSSTNYDRDRIYIIR